jgi:hypothetical protein
MRVVLGVLGLVGIAGTASADVVTLNLTKSADAFNTSPSAPYPDVNYGNLSTNPSIFVVWHRYVTSSAKYSNKRANIDFVLPPALLQPNIVINSATLTLPPNNESSSGFGTLVVHGIPSTSSPFTLADFPQDNPVATQPIVPLACCSAPTRVIEVKSWVQQRRDAGFDRVAFQLAAEGDWGFNLAVYSSATLTVNYSAVIGAAPTLEVVAPSSGSSFVQGEELIFSAVANDAEDGTLDAAIEWSSSLNGSLGTGATVVTSSLSAGSHVITARITDSDGNVVTQSLNLTLLPNTNTPPTVSISLPADNASFTQGGFVSFQAGASDVEDGNLTSAITWSSSLDGLLGSGGNISRSNLSIGSHLITATVVDSQGNTTTAVRNISVQAPVNTAPIVSISSPANGASLSAGVSFTLSGSANDAQQGNMSSSIQWLLNGSTVIANGASASASISNPGSYSIVARVTDNGGLTGSQTVNLTVASAPPSYCALRANYPNYEHIAGVRSGTTVNNSGANLNGYQDFTGVAFQWPVGSNPLSLVPGFSSGSYSERWAVWIDLNRDKVFSANELLYTGMSSTTINTSIAIPAGTATGPTRMRVALSYGTTPPACGTYTYGEVEDYTVNIGATGGAPTYCASRGTSSAGEWLQYFVTNNNTSRATGNDGGYHDYTADWPISLPRGYNYVDVFPFFANGATQTEFWNVWIDFNSDGTFAPEELVSNFSSFGSSTYNGFNVPGSLNPGLKTRMRIQMKRGSAPMSACETFANGEVEDHTVQIR